MAERRDLVGASERERVELGDPPAAASVPDREDDDGRGGDDEEHREHDDGDVFGTHGVGVRRLVFRTDPA